jgi:hypothetical protein
MYLSAERMALASQTVQETFEQTCVAWQAIPHWDTGDPGQTVVRADDIDNPTAAALVLDPVNVAFTVTLAQVISPTPDALLAVLMDKTVDLAKQVDDKVLPYVRSKAKAPERRQRPSQPAGHRRKLHQRNRPHAPHSLRDEDQRCERHRRYQGHVARLQWP